MPVSGLGCFEIESKIVNAVMQLIPNQQGQGGTDTSPFRIRGAFPNLTITPECIRPSE